MPAASVVALIADGMTFDEITTEDPDLTRKPVKGHRDGAALCR